MSIHQSDKIKATSRTNGPRQTLKLQATRLFFKVLKEWYSTRFREMDHLSYTIEGCSYQLICFRVPRKNAESRKCNG
jgi:hypothetical protein